MDDFFSLIVSPFGFITLFFFIFFSLIFIFIPLKYKNKSSKLLIHFKGKFLFPLGTIVFSYRGVTFFISRISRGGGSYGGGGSYPVLWGYVENCPKFIIGNVQSKDYTRGNFLRLPPYEIIQTADREILIGSTDEIFMVDLKNKISHDSKLAQDITSLVKEKFAHLTVSREFHINRKFIQSKNVFRLTSMSEDIYQNPSLLESQLNVIVSLFEVAGIQFKA